MNIEERITNLTKKQSKLLQKSLNLNSKETRNSKVICFYVSNDGKHLANPAEKLAKELPSYMIPDFFVRVDEIPRLPNGKIDNSKLQSIKIEDNKVDVNGLPSNDIEILLLSIWKEVLDNELIGVNDNFFEVGGDSISSIRIIAKARNEGLKILPNQLFEYQSISLLAKNIIPDLDSGQKESLAKYYGQVKLTPIQLWFFSKHKNNPSYWNQVFLIKLKKEISSDILMKVFSRLIEDYDSLSYTYEFSNENGFAKLKEFSLPDYCHLVSGKSFQQDLRKIQEKIHVEKGPLFRFLIIDQVDGHCKSIALVAHHLIIDAVSWSLLIDRIGVEIELSLGLNSDQIIVNRNRFKNWIDLIYSNRVKKIFEQERKYWIDETSDISKIIEISSGFEKDVSNCSYSLSEESTSVLTSDALDAYSSKVQELVLTAYVLSLFQFHKAESITVWIEQHGRNLLEDEDLSEYIGWFTSFYPLRLDGRNSVNESIINVKDRFRSVPNMGIGYGYLRFIKGIRELAIPEEFVFNYLGTRSKVNTKLIESIEFVMDGARASESEIANGIELNCWLESAELKCSFRFNSKHYNSEFQDHFVSLFDSNINQIIEYCVGTDKTFTTSDFPDAELSEDDLNELFNQV